MPALLSSSKHPIRVAVAGLGRMGMIHALHIHELAQESDLCRLTAVSTIDKPAADRFLAMTGASTPVVSDIAALARSDMADVTIIATNTPLHREHALMMIEAGQRVFLEKPLTGTLDGDREFAALLQRDHPQSLMLGFQRRFDAPTLFAKQLIDQGAIGRVFKIYSSLEDSGPAPDGFASPGILADMSVHNVDEVLWLSGRKPTSAMAIGSRIYSHRLTTCDEDFDDALMLLEFDDDHGKGQGEDGGNGGGLIAQIQVTRNHVSGYRGETVIYGEQGLIRIGSFNQKLLEVNVEAFGRRDATEPLAVQKFEMRRYGQPLPEFIDRYGAAYKQELRTFLECCRDSKPFPVTHLDGLRAQEIVAAAMSASIQKKDMAAIKYRELP